MMAERDAALNPHFRETIQNLGYSQDVIWRAEEYCRLMADDHYTELLRTVFGQFILNPND